MEQSFRIEELAGTKGRALLPPELARQSGLADELTIAVGCSQAEGRKAAWVPAKSGSVALSRDLIERLCLRPGMRCRARAGARTLRLGPAVAVLAGRTRADLTASRLQAMANHFLTEVRRGGLFYACDLESIDPDGKAVQGFLLQGGPTESWEEALLPLPQVLFRRYGIGLGQKFDALRAHGVKIMNERIFHKGEAWQWLAESPSVRPHLPETRALQGVADIAAMLREYQSLFVKPVWGSLGSNILRIDRLEGGGFRLDRSGSEAVTCADEAELEAVLREGLPRPGIVQQGLRLAKVGGRLVDFRVVVQKERTGGWGVPGVVGRCGTEGLFLSNMATGGFPLPAEQGLALLFGSDSVTLFRRRQELISLGVAVGEALERSGLLLCDLGLDIAYDLQGHPWVIEVNNRDPDHNIGWESGQWPLFYQFRTLPAEYASSLAGFGRREGEDSR